MIIGFTGTQNGMSRDQMRKLKSLLRSFNRVEPIMSVYHGGCVGADSEFHEICLMLKPRPWIAVFPSNIKHKQGDWAGASYVAPEAPPLVRNRRIASGRDFLIAAPEQNTEILRSGTWATIRYAKKLKVPVIILYR